MAASEKSRGRMEEAIKGKGRGRGLDTHTHTHTQQREREREREREEYSIVPSCGGFQVFDEESRVSDLADGCAAYRSAAENNVI